jgi:flavin-binding protein dodecin
MNARRPEGRPAAGINTVEKVIIDFHASGVNSRSCAFLQSRNRETGERVIMAGRAELEVGLEAIGAIQPKAYLAVLLSHTVPQQGIPEMTIMKDKNKKDQPSVAKVVELIGSSPNSWEEATENAVEAAAKTLRNIRGVDVQRFKAKVKDNRIVEYRVDVKIAFIVEME